MVAATKPRSRDIRVPAGADGRDQPLLADGLGYVVVLDLVSEGPGHSAAAAVDLGRMVSRAGLKQGQRIAGAGQGFLVAMAVIQDSRFVRFEAQRARGVAKPVGDEG